MKKFSSLVAAALLGSVITLGTYHIFNSQEQFKTIQSVEKVPAIKAAYTLNENGEAVPLDFTKAAEKVMPAVVHIRSTQKYAGRQDMQQIPAPFREFFGPQRPRGPRQGSGSGVIINNDGYIVTNNHVIDNADEIEVTLHDNRSFIAEVIGTDPNTDLGLIKIKEKDLPYLPLVDSDKVKVGEWVLAVGNPFNLNSTVTAGIVSAKGRNIGIINDDNNQDSLNTSIESFIQTDAAVNPGNSGGALTNLNGDLVGINTAIASPTGAYSGYSFAVPANIVSKVIEDLMTYGVVQRGWLGVTINNVNTEFARQNDLEVITGAYISNLAENSGAKEAGVKSGDVITKIDDIEVNNTSALIGYIGSKRPGDKVNIVVNRNGKEKSFEVLLKNREGNTKVVKKEDKDLSALLGVELEAVEEGTLKRLGLKSGVRVKSITNGKVRRSTDMREGFIITEVDSNEVSTPEEVLEYLEDKKDGALIKGVYENAPGNYYYGIGLE